ncbi:unnamed protein product [Dibothriocephalus latus]|uniref:Uncharacterized protein n=1 Tax=Dibothriocephalus latus TaxID=60516 RepID=A0A3P7NR38_DIBLA|nr:unnamed protein product [Dibothriocephalus latus]
MPFLPILPLNPSAVTGTTLSTVSRTQPICLCSPDAPPYLPSNNLSTPISASDSTTADAYPSAKLQPPCSLSSSQSWLPLLWCVRPGG